MATTGRRITADEMRQLADKLETCGGWSIGYYYGGEFCQLVNLSDNQRLAIIDGLRTEADDQAGIRRPEQLGAMDW